MHTTIPNASCKALPTSFGTKLHVKVQEQISAAWVHMGESRGGNSVELY